MTPGDVFTVVRDAYYRECPNGSFEGYGLTPPINVRPKYGGWFAKVPGVMLTHLYFWDGRTDVRQRGNPDGSIWLNRGSIYYADPKYLQKVLHIVFLRD